MSGGSYDYIGYKISDISLSHTDTDPRRAAFQELLKLVGHAMYAVEWVDSGDHSPGDEHKAIDKCLAFLTRDHETVRKAAAYDVMSKTLKEFFKWEEIV